jgi:uncharacterized protein YxeA
MNPVTALILVAILLILAWMFWKKNNGSKAPNQFVTLDKDAAKLGMIPKVSASWIDEINKKYESKDYDKYDNRHFAFSNKLCNQVYSEYKYWEKGESHYDFLSKLHDTQKMYFALINFEGQTNNGGVYQFLFNQPENAIVALEAMKKAKLIRLAEDYEIVLNEFFGKFKTIEELRSKFQNKSINWDKRWNSFVEGYKEIPQAEVIEGYFYEKEYSKDFHSNMAQFVIDNQNELMRIE